MEVGFCGDYNGLLLRLSYDKRTENVKGVNTQDYLHTGFLALTAIHMHRVMWILLLGLALIHVDDNAKVGN